MDGQMVGGRVGGKAVVSLTDTFVCQRFTLAAVTVRIPSNEVTGACRSQQERIGRGGGSELVLERWALGRGGRRKRAHSRPRRSGGKCVAAIWGGGRWWTQEEAKCWEQVAGSGVKSRTAP